jgi:hypothetical protein
MSKKNNRHGQPQGSGVSRANAGGGTATARPAGRDPGQEDDAGLGHEAMDSAQGFLRNAGEYVSNRPMTSVLTGFGLGFGLGVFLAMVLDNRESRSSRSYLGDRFRDYADSLKDLPQTAREYLSQFMDRR